MKTMRLEIELTYDDDVMHGNDVGAFEWFKDEVLGGELVLHSNEIGDAVGMVKVIRILDASPDSTRADLQPGQQSTSSAQAAD